MFWADTISDDIQANLKAKIASGKTLVVRDEKTASGRVHIGSMRGVAIHGLVTDVLKKAGVDATFKYEINDFDPMDGLPVYLDKEEYGRYMGKQLFSIPSPDGKAENFAEYFAQEFIDVIETADFHPEFYRARELYQNGKMNDVIKSALDNAADIRRIYKEVSGSERGEDWYPLSVVCEKCGNVGTTNVSEWNGEKVTYRCNENQVEWATGCGNEGETSPFDGRAKLPWKVEWAAKWKVLEVDIEGAGKDHSTKGGARDVANHISREVFGYEPPFDIPYEFFLVGGKKMSSSKGAGSSATEIAALVPTKVLRLVLFGTKPMRAINLDPAGDTIPAWFDWYDKVAEKHWGGEGDDDARLFELVHDSEPPKQMYLPRFSTTAFLTQMEHLNMVEEIEKIKESLLTESERAELSERAEYAKHWLVEYAPEKYKFELQDTLPEGALNFTKEQKSALASVGAYIESHKDISGQDMHTALHEIRKESGVEPKEFFSALYTILLGKEEGPKAGWFLSVLDREFLLKRLGEVSDQVA